MRGLARDIDVVPFGKGLFLALGERGFARHGIFLAEFGELFFDDVELQFLAPDDRGEFFNTLLEFLELLFEFEDFELGEAGETKVEDGLRLFFGEVEALSEFLPRIGRAVRRFDDLDDFVDVPDGDDEAWRALRRAYPLRILRRMTFLPNKNSS